MENKITFMDICAARRRGDEITQSNLSIMLAVERVKKTGATTCGVVAVAKIPGTWARVRQIILSMQFGYTHLRVQFECEEGCERFEEVVALVPRLDEVWASRLARHVETVVLADNVNRDGLVEAISRLRPGCRPAGFFLPPNSFVEAVMASRGPVI